MAGLPSAAGLDPRAALLALAALVLAACASAQVPLAAVESGAASPAVAPPEVTPAANAAPVSPSADEDDDEDEEDDAPPARARPAPPVKPAARADSPQRKVGDAAPMFGPMKLHNPNESGLPTFSLGDFVGPDASKPAKALVLSFFATWCEPCKKELPFLVDLYRRHRARGLQVVVVSIDKEEEAFKQVRELIAANGVVFPVVMDRFNLVARRYLGEKTAMPSIFLLKQDGTIAVVKQGYDGEASKFLTAEVTKLLGP